MFFGEIEKDLMLIYFPAISLIRNSLFSFEGQLCSFSWVLSLMGRYFYIMYIVKIFEIVIFFTVKDNNIFPCLRNIRLSYNI